MERRISDYKATMEIMKKRGVKGLGAQAASPGVLRAPGLAAGAAAAPVATPQPLQIFAEGDSWFDYPVPFFGGGIIPRLESKLGVPILNLAKAGDEVRYMMGVDERRILEKHFIDGCPAGGPWDVMLFSGGGNDIVGAPMALWVKDYVAGGTAINQPRYDDALGMVTAGYEDLITMRNTLSPTTHLVFHAYDWALPDGRGICGMGPWLKPTFDVRKFPTTLATRSAVVKQMLVQFATILNSLATKNPDVTFINGQGTLAPITSSWHNELHPSRGGFNQFATLFQSKLKALFPTRVP